MLKDYFGKIAIYKVYPSGESTLMSIVDIDINSLPEKDREHLQKGNRRYDRGRDAAIN